MLLLRAFGAGSAGAPPAFPYALADVVRRVRGSAGPICRRATSAERFRRGKANSSASVSEPRARRIRDAEMSCAKLCGLNELNPGRSRTGLLCAFGGVPLQRRDWPGRSRRGSGIRGEARPPYILEFAALQLLATIRRKSRPDKIII